jgi:folylpolyglutamate synthase/dihydropteroate synthase
MLNQQRWQVWKSPLMWLLVVFLLALPLLADFNARLAYSRQLATEEANLSQQIATEKTKHDQLLKLQAYVKSDAYVEHWARMSRMAKPGEVPVVLVPIDGAHAPHAAVGPTPTTNDTSSEWWTVFFGVSTPTP